nr:hypothetical protein F27D9.7 - Caenorhabditis elegans [Caenorhabditis elegans]
MGLDDFISWKKEQQNLIEHDVTVLLRHNYEGGIAYSNGICSKNSLMISGFLPDATMNNAWVFMHQLAHVIGLTHKQQTKCECNTAINGSGFPECSVQEMVDKLSNSSCLIQESPSFAKNTVVPKKGSLPVCGNGLQEDEEECDCGPERFCDNILCDAVKCRFIVQKAYLTTFIPLGFAFIAFVILLFGKYCLCSLFASLRNTGHREQMEKNRGDIENLNDVDVEQAPMRSYIIILFAISISLFICTIYCCPNEPTEILFIIKASYYLSEYQWESVKALLGKVSGSVNLGRSSEASQIGVYLFDNLNMPVPVIGLGTYGRSSDLKTAVSKLKLLPCGTWCAEQTQKTDAEQITSILTKQAFTRPAKIFIITSEYIDSYSLHTLVTTANNLVIQQVIIPQTPGVVSYDAPYYNYYRAYYDNYRRYASRMEQVYPYMHVEIPSDQYQFIQQDTRYGNYDYESWPSSTCYSLIGCQECMTSPAILPSVDSTAETVQTSEATAENSDSGTIHSGDSKHTENIIDTNRKLSAELVTEKAIIPTTPPTEDYEYEITGDPPGRRLDLGDVNIVICNAAILSFTSFMEISDELLRKCLDVNIFGTINVSLLKMKILKYKQSINTYS